MMGHRAVAACRVTGRPAVVLGSTQPAHVVNKSRCDALGVDIVRRRSGGGAVLVAADAQVWMDIWIPRDDALWDDDVIEAATWLGRSWATALETLGVGQVHVHRGAMVTTTLSPLICFAGTGPGEVFSASRKLVGLAQRRTRLGARFHSMALLSWDPEALAQLLTLDTVAWSADRQQLTAAAVGLRDVLPAGDGDELLVAVEDAFIAALP